MYLVLADAQIMSITIVTFNQVPKLIAFILIKMLIAQPSIMQRLAIRQTNSRAMYLVSVLLVVTDENNSSCTDCIKALTNQSNNDNENILFDVALVLIGNCFVKLIATTVYPQLMLKLNL